MAHPLEINLSELTDDELNDRISDLYARVKFLDQMVMQTF